MSPRPDCILPRGSEKHWLRLQCIATILYLSYWPTVIQAQAYEHDGGVQDFANRALATFGLVAIPNDTASFLSMKQLGQDETSFRSSQLGGGFTLENDKPIYLEGFLGFQRYDPRFILSDSLSDIEVRAKWYGLAASGGIGYDFPLGNNWTFRPILNVAVGKITSEVNVRLPITAGKASPDTEFLEKGDITAGGLGASLMLEYNEHKNGRDLDFTLRHTHMRLASIGKSSDLNARADAISTSAWARARTPIGNLRAFGSPVRSVWQASLSYFEGDQGDILGIDWMAKVGFGVELGTENTELPLLKKTRLMLSYAAADGYRGYSVGLGFSF